MQAISVWLRNVFLLMTIVFPSPPASSQETVIVKTDFEQYSLKPKNIAYFLENGVVVKPMRGDEDFASKYLKLNEPVEKAALVSQTLIINSFSAGAMGISEAKAKADEFVIESKPLSLGFYPHPVWLKIKVSNADPESRDLVLKGNVYVGEMWIYSPSGVVTHKTIGAALPFETQELKDLTVGLNSIANSIHLTETGEYEIYLRSLSFGDTTEMQFKLLSASSWHKASKFDAMILAIFFTCLCTMLVYNFSISILIRDVDFFYYSMYLVGVICAYSYLLGLNSWMFSPDVILINPRAWNLSIFWTMTFLLLYCRSFLRLKVHSKYLSNICLVVVAIWCISNLTMPEGILFVQLMLILAVASILFMYCTAIYLSLKGIREARFFAIAFTLHFSGTFLRISQSFGSIETGVFTLYSGEIGTIAEVLLFALAMGDRISVLGKSLGIANKELEKHRDHLDDMVKEKIQEISSILDNVRMGIITIEGEALTISQHCAQETFVLLEESDFQGKTLKDAFLDRLSLGDDEKNLILSSLQSAIGQDLINFQVNSQHLPNEASYVSPGGKEKLFEIEWSTVLDDSECVRKILIAFKDVAELKRLRTISLKSELSLRKVSEIIRNQPKDFFKFCSKVDVMLDENRRLTMAGGAHEAERLKTMFFNLHTLKGLARFLGLSEMCDLCHRCEQNFVDILSGKTRWDQAITLINLQGIASSMGSYKEIATEQLGWRANEIELVKLPTVTFGQLVDSSEEIFENVDGKLRVSAAYVYETLVSYYYTRLDEVLSEFSGELKRLARDLKKAEPKLVIEGGDYRVSPLFAQLLQNVMIHLLRNSMDHGIEYIEDRVLKNKNPEGTINVCLEVQATDIVFRYSDDGQGLALSKIKAKAETLSIIPSGSEMGNLEIAMLIFHPGFSTTNNVSDISGRGVGMSAVLEFIQKHKGTLALDLGEKYNHRSLEYISFSIVISINRRDFKIVESMKRDITKRCG
ncbi:MAG TPA: 7TM diverse intracellular signaling domain-containing protein [Oligoflexus sp.]|uniref:7TM diverse intracellular signaling domain-containing protein n=1 Tax=Oligoflexus sp. TaxID=1971216 RepID=UPI002D6176C5|nr:7TM diverse intracellular signaling domain-containing protein [Oligoflexus sp.]HYX32188.1 7TM diverse intracellular signaling domain-containing protein [Oligoflexus sp.]